MSKASRGWKKQAKMKNRYFHRVKKDPLGNKNASYKKMGLKAYRQEKRRKNRSFNKIQKGRNLNNE